MDKQILEVRLAASHCVPSGGAAREGKAWRDGIREIPERKGGSAHAGVIDHGDHGSSLPGTRRKT